MSDLPVRVTFAVSRGGTFEEFEVGGLLLERDDRASAVRKGVRAVVPLVRPEVEDDRSRVVGPVHVVRCDELERLPVDRVVVLGKEDLTWPIAQRVRKLGCTFRRAS